MTMALALVGALLLMIAGDALVRGAIALSVKLGLSVTLISLTVVALGTSAPELVTSIRAALDGSPDIALGNVVGSNIANVLLIVGVPAVILSLHTKSRELRFSFGLMIVATAVFAAVAMTGGIGRIAGFGLLAVLAAMTYASYRFSSPPDPALEGIGGDLSGAKIAFLLIAGIVGLPLGAHLLIEGARAIALHFGLSEAAIGLTIVALGTSLPELAASTAAAIRGRGDVALGNVLGSNMINLLAVIGITAAITPLTVSSAFQSFDIPVMCVVSLFLAPFLIWGKRIGRLSGLTFLICYALFAVFALRTGSA